MRVVIDTNCLIASIPPKNEEFWLYRFFAARRFTWVVSTEILNEYAESLANFYSPETAELVLHLLLSAPNVELAEPFFRWTLIADDPDDNKFSDLALSTNAHYLISNDRHFRVLKMVKFPPLKVLTLKQFKKALNE
jgi:putative PIN family toxin of toxin-antitoxin system